MKKIIVFLLGLFMMSTAVRAALTDEPPVAFVNKLTDKIIQDVLSSDKPKQEKLEGFREYFTKALDLKNIGQFVLGVYWRKTTPAEKDAFLDAFMDFTTKTWADRFDMYQGQNITFVSVRDGGQNQYYVDSVIQNNPPVEVVWRVREKNGVYRIIDIVVEGVSMAMSYRNEYSSFLQTHDGQVSALTHELTEKSKNFVFSESPQK